MSVSDGQKANATNFNNAFVSRTTDSNTIGKIDLDNTDGASGTAISNVQREHNSIASFTGKAVNVAENASPTWSSDTIGTPNENVKSRVDAVQASLETNNTETADIRTTTGTATNDTDMGTFTGTTISDNVSIKTGMQELETEVELKEDSANKGVANGYCELDGTGLVPASRLPVSGMTFEGNWNASTNTPTLSDATGSQGEWYNVATGGTQDLGSGSITFDLGDSLIHDGSVWVKLDNIDSVTPTNTVSLTNKTIDGDLNTISNLAHGAEVDNPSSGVHGVTGSVVGTSDTQVLTNKDIDGGTASNTNRITLPKNTTVNLDALTDKEATLAYDTTLGRPVYNDGSVWNSIGTGDGAGDGINYILNNDFEDNINDVSTNDADITLSEEITNPLRGARSLRSSWTTAVDIGDYVAFSMQNIDLQDVGKSLTVSFDYSTDADIAVDELEVRLRNSTSGDEQVIFNGDNGRIVPTGSETNFSRFVGRVSAFDTTSNLGYELRIYSLVSRGALAQGELLMDRVKVGPDSVVPGAIINNWKSVDNPSSLLGNITLGTGATVEMYQRRVGENLEFHGTIILGTGGAITGDLFLSLPDSLNFNENVILENYAPRNNAGWCSLLDSGATRLSGTVGTRTGTLNQFILHPNRTSTTYNSLDFIVNATQPFTWTVNDAIQFFINVPIDGWSSGAMLSTTEAVFSTAKLDAGIVTFTGSIFGTSDVKVPWDDIRTDNLASYNSTNDQYVIPRDGFYTISANLLSSAQTAGEHTGSIYLNNVFLTSGQNESVNTNVQCNVSCSREFQKGDLIDIRVRHDTDASWDLNSNSCFSVVEHPDFSTFSVHGDYEVLDATSNTVTPVANGLVDSVTDGLSGNFVTCSPGRWRLQGRCAFTSSGGTAGITNVEAYLADAVDTFTIATGLIAGTVRDTLRLSTGQIESVETRMNAIVQITQTTSFYVTPQITATTIGNARVIANIYAERIS